MNKTVLIIVIVAIVALLGSTVYMLMGGKDDAKQQSNNDTNNNQQAQSGGSLPVVKVEYSAVYADSGFTPNSIDIPAGNELRIMNSSDKTQNFRLVSKNLKSGFELEPGEALAFPVLTEKGEYTVETGDGKAKLVVIVK